jgi:hypothetical protein
MPCVALGMNSASCRGRSIRNCVAKTRRGPVPREIPQRVGPATANRTPATKTHEIWRTPRDLVASRAGRLPRPDPGIRVRHADRARALQPAMTPMRSPTPSQAVNRVRLQVRIPVQASRTGAPLPTVRAPRLAPQLVAIDRVPSAGRLPRVSPTPAKASRTRHRRAIANPLVRARLALLGQVRRRQQANARKPPNRAKVNRAKVNRVAHLDGGLLGVRRPVVGRRVQATPRWPSRPRTRRSPRVDQAPRAKRTRSTIWPPPSMGGTSAGSPNDCGMWRS